MGWCKLDIEFLKQLLLKVNQNSIKHYLKIILNIKVWKCIEHFLYGLMISQSEAPVTEEKNCAQT